MPTNENEDKAKAFRRTKKSEFAKLRKGRMLMVTKFIISEWFSLRCFLTEIGILHRIRAFFLTNFIQKLNVARMSKM